MLLPNNSAAKGKEYNSNPEMMQRILWKRRCLQPASICLWPRHCGRKVRHHPSPIPPSFCSVYQDLQYVWRHLRPSKYVTMITDEMCYLKKHAQYRHHLTYPYLKKCIYKGHLNLFIFQIELTLQSVKMVEYSLVHEKNRILVFLIIWFIWT